MKTMLKLGAAALALSMMTTASAFAQAGQTAAPAAQGAMPGSGQMDSQSDPGMAGQGGMAAPGAQAPAPGPDQGSMSQGGMGQGGMGQGSMSNGAAPQGGMTTGAAATGNTPAGSPPATYPRCTHKGEDRCIQEASNGGSHHMKHHMMKPKTSTDATDTSTPPAPGQ